MDALFFHPKWVHLPIALAVLMPLVAGGLLVALWRKWLPRRAWSIAVLLQAVLLGSGIVALRTGENEEERVERVVAEAAIEAHEEAAEAFVIASGVVLALMLVPLALRDSIALPAAGLGLLGTLAVFGLGYRTGQAGGELVYQHGAAQAYVAPLASSRAGPEPAGTTARVDRDDDDD